MAMKTNMGYTGTIPNKRFQLKMTFGFLWCSVDSYVMATLQLPFYPNYFYLSPLNVSNIKKDKLLQNIGNISKLKSDDFISSNSLRTNSIPNR